jgi:cholesterol transport system auxiliary component
MRLMLRTLASIALAASVSGCSLGGLLGGGGKPPAYLVTLTPEAAEPAQMARAASAGQAVTIGAPDVPKELRTIRVPVQLNPTDVQYVTNLTLIDTPDRLFANLVAETVRRTTNRVVLDPRQSTLDPGVTITGELRRFGYDAASSQVIVQFDATMATAGGNGVQTRRFTATAPADGTAATVGPALNRAANEVALDVARWIGNAGA